MATKLNVHKSNIERTRRKEIRGEMMHAAKDISSQNDIRAYAIVALNADGHAFASWDTGGIIPMWSFASTVKAVLQSEMECNLDVEDFKAPLVRKY